MKVNYFLSKLPAGGSVITEADVEGFQSKKQNQHVKDFPNTQQAVEWYTLKSVL